MSLNNPVPFPRRKKPDDKDELQTEFYFSFVPIAIPVSQVFYFSYIILGSNVARDKNDVIPIGSTGWGRRHRVIYNRTGDIWFSVSFAEIGLTLF